VASFSERNAATFNRNFLILHPVIIMASKINESLASKVHYCMATASARTQHVTVGDIIVSINGELLFTTPDDVRVYAGDTDAYFNAVRAKIVAAKAPRVARFIRFFRNIYRGRIVAPRDAKLSHTEMSHLFDPAHHVAMASFQVGEAEPRADDEAACVREAREAGASSFVFDVVFPDTEPLGINLWPNLLVWSRYDGV
jgi:hypothetical protein